MEHTNHHTFGSKAVTRFVLALAIAAVGLAFITTPAGAAPGDAGTFDRFSFTNAAGTRTYKVAVPPGYDGRPLPLLVDLHGCGSNADEEARWSQFNTIAAARNVVVAYPEQDPAANGGRCWNWFLPDHQVRDKGEPSIIAGITREVISRWNIDARAVSIAGISAGGAMSDVMAATYPDLFAAAMVYAGCEYKGTTCTGGLAALPADVSGRMAYEAMGPRARVLPVLVIQGDVDPVVPPYNAELVVQQFLATDDLADDGLANASIATTRSSTAAGVKPGGQTYDIDDYRDATGCLVARRWLVHGMAHQWSNATPNGSPRDALLTDPLGPDVSNPTFDFLFSYRLPAAGTGCTAALASTSASAPAVLTAAPESSPAAPSSQGPSPSPSPSPASAPRPATMPATGSGGSAILAGPLMAAAILSRRLARRSRCGP